MVEQVSGFMDKIKDMDAEEAEGADTVLAEKFNSMDALSTDAAIDLLQVYSSCDASGRDAVAKTFYALSGESFDSYLMTACGSMQENARHARARTAAACKGEEPLPENRFLARGVDSTV